VFDGVAATRAQMPRHVDENATLAYIEVNNLAHLIEYRSQFRGYEGSGRLPDGRRMALAPRQNGEVAGFPTLAGTREDLLFVLSKPGRALWVPVTCEQYIEAMIRDLETDIEQHVTYGEQAHWTEQQAKLIEDRKRADPWLAALHAELDSKTAAERASEAWFGSRNGNPFGSGIVPPHTPGAEQVAVVNPDYFDYSLPRTAIQLILVRTNQMDVGLHTQSLWNAHYRRAREFVDTADWKGVYKLIE